MLKKTLGLVVFALSLLVNYSAFAEPAYCEENIAALVQTLNLSTEQQEKIKPSLTDLKMILHTKGSAMDAIDKQIDKQVYNGLINDSINGLVDKKVTLIGDIIKAKMTAKKQIFAVLNDQQKSVLQIKMKQLQTKLASQYKQCHTD